MRFNIEGVAKLLDVSTRTVSRAISNEPNGHLNPEKEHISLENLALIYDCDPEVFRRARTGAEQYALLTPQEAAHYLTIPERTFRYKQKKGLIKPVLRNKKTIRFTRDYLDSLEI